MKVATALMMGGMVVGACLDAGEAYAQDVTLRVAHATSPDSSYAKATQFLADRLDELTEGRIAVREFGGGSLGSETTTIDLYETGDIDLGFHFTSAMAPVVERMGFFDAPFLFDDFDHWQRAMVSDEAKEIMQGYLDEGNKPFSIAMIGLSGERNIYTKGTVLDNMEDLQGFSIRVPESPIAARVWRTLGLVPTAVPWPDVYSALEAGLVDGAENTPNWYFDSRHIEVAKNYHWTRHLFGTAIVLVGKDTLDRIPEDLKDEFQQALDETEVYWTETQVAADQTAVDTHFPELNVVQHEVPEDFAQEIRAQVQPMAGEIAEELDTVDMLEMINAKK